MAKPITPEGRVDHWKKRWSSPRLMTDEETEAVFEEFVDGFVPGHMEKKFRQFFGTPRAKFGNRFFSDDATFYPWEVTLAAIGVQDVVHAEVAVVYASPDAIEGYRFRGEPRRSLKDLFVDDWHPACAIVTAGDTKLYIFIEPKMRGSIVYRAVAEAE